MARTPSVLLALPMLELFLTSLNGKMWRLWTSIDDFPHGLSAFQFGNCLAATLKRECL